jgi:hypothetical protein
MFLPFWMIPIPHMIWSSHFRYSLKIYCIMFQFGYSCISVLSVSTICIRISCNLLWWIPFQCTFVSLILDPCLWPVSGNVCLLYSLFSSFVPQNWVNLTLTYLDSLLFTLTHQKCMISDDPEMGDEEGSGEDNEDFGISLHAYKWRALFWDVVPCSNQEEVHWHFGELHCLHLQGQIGSQARN